MFDTYYEKAPLHGLSPGEKFSKELLANAENTLPTDHNRINIAKVRAYDYNDALKWQRNPKSSPAQ